MSQVDPRKPRRPRGGRFESPEGEQNLLAPLVGGLLGSVLRTWERRAALDSRHGGPPLRILADEGQ